MLAVSAALPPQDLAPQACRHGTEVCAFLSWPRGRLPISVAPYVTKCDKRFWGWEGDSPRRLPLRGAKLCAAKKRHAEAAFPAKATLCPAPSRRRRPNASSGALGVGQGQGWGEGFGASARRFHRRSRRLPRRANGARLASVGGVVFLGRPAALDSPASAARATLGECSEPARGGSKGSREAVARATLGGCSESARGGSTGSREVVAGRVWASSAKKQPCRHATRRVCSGRAEQGLADLLEMKEKEPPSSSKSNKSASPQAPRLTLDPGKGNALSGAQLSPPPQRSSHQNHEPAPHAWSPEAGVACPALRLSWRVRDLIGMWSHAGLNRGPYGD